MMNRKKETPYIFIKTIAGIKFNIVLYSTKHLETQNIGLSLAWQNNLLYNVWHQIRLKSVNLQVKFFFMNLKFLFYYFFKM